MEAASDDPYGFGFVPTPHRRLASPSGRSWLESLGEARRSLRRQRWLRSDACRGCTAILAIVGGLLLLRLSSSERALLIELGCIDEAVGELAREHPRARVLDLPVYFINADDDTRARAAIEEQLAALRPPAVRRIASVDGMLHLDEDRSQGGFPGQTAAELGRTLSHLAAARQLLDDGHEAALVVEDSVRLGLAPRWPFRLSELVSQLPPEWTTLQLYHTADMRYAPRGDPSRPALTIVPYGGAHMSGTAAYVLSRRGADGLMRATRGGHAVHRGALATRNGLTDTILYEFPHATPWAVWPRYAYARSDGGGAGARSALREAYGSRAIVDHARATWPCARPGPAPADADHPDADADESESSALIVFGDVAIAGDPQGFRRR